jgi:hypothetical protein
MERLRILAAAAALGEFTVEELVAFSGANENTVRAVLRRERELFEATGAEPSGGQGGRPANRYRLIDEERVRAEVHDLERDVVLVAGGGDTGSPPSAEDDRLAAIVVAEDALLRSLSATDGEDRRVLAGTARESLRQATEDAGPGLPDRLTRRAASVSAIAELAERRAAGAVPSHDELARTSEALGELAELAPQEHFWGLLGGLADAAIEGHELPPLGIVTHRELSPENVLPHTQRSSWTCEELPGGRELVWSQRWAAPLLRRHLVSAVVLTDPNPAGTGLSESFDHLRGWTIPRIVVSERESMEAATEIAACGAQFLPSSQIEFLGYAVRNSVAQRTGLISSAGIIAAMPDLKVRY